MISVEILGQLNITEEQLSILLDEDVREIFSTMVGSEISPSETVATETRFKECVTAMVGFVGSYNGMISINTRQKLAMSFASQMLGMDIVECDDDVYDALGEIANMLGGSFKHHFVKDGHEVRLSTPSVISGEEYVMTMGSVRDTLTLMFRSGEESFMVSVYLESGE
ncbi:MAG: chemotaxis protein CheX [Pelobacteraceae bacterium]